MQQPMLAQPSSHFHQPAYLRKRQRRPKRSNVDSHQHHQHAEHLRPLQQHVGHHQAAHSQPQDDLVVFRQFYDAQLKSLTFNSRQIIQDLSQTALKYSRLSAIVVDCLDIHIRRAPLPEKLPGFYLLDSIVKNGPDPYAHQFAPRVGSLFLDTHRVVDADTRSKMEAMLVTWRTGSPNGRELFGVNVQSHIERTLWGSKPTFQPHPSRVEVLVKLDASLAERERSLMWDPTAITQVEALRQLKTMVQSSELTPSDLSAIMGQLCSMPPVSLPLLAMPQVAPIVVPPVPAPVVPSVDPSLLSSISGLYNSLMKAGVLAALPATTPTVNETKPADPKKEYECSILRMKTDLSAATLTKTRPQIVPWMYERQSLQCKQCSARFPNTEEGSKRMDDHLDMHFRQNRKMEQVGRGHSRSWFVGAESFTHEGSGVTSKGKSLEQGTITTSAEREAELKRSFVVVPVGQEAQTVVCPVCKEQLQAQFKDDDEEWVWNNAISISGKIFHATCHAEVTSSRALAVIEKLRTESRSRSNTPNERSPIRKSFSPLPPVAGMKRSAAEALDEGSNPGSPRVGQSPLKKRAVGQL